ncbi:MAG: radical SAM protein [Candidatus Eremiobacteraeota bacterium]|nr:radical SAM protein [Candidatus Eremiobacteraeota bacterium]
MKKVLVIDPGIRFLRGAREHTIEDSHFPRGAMSIATFLRSRGVDTEFLFLDALRQRSTFGENVSLIYDTLRGVISGRDYSLIAIGGPFTIQMPLIQMVAEMARDLSPRSHIALGGVHASFLSERSLEEVSCADSVIRGEAEWTSLELAHRLAGNLPLEGLEGLTYRDGAMIRINGLRSPGRLEELPMIDYGLIPRRLYNEVMINLTASRGCAFKCTFCAEQRFWGNRVRIFPVEALVDEIRHVSSLSEKPIFSIEDSMISLKSPYFFRFCDALKALPSRDYFISHINSRVDAVCEEGLSALRDMGVSRVAFGVESASGKVLKAMNKGITRADMEKACRMVRDYGVAVATLWIFGHPGDDPSESEVSIRALEDFYVSDLQQVSVISMFIPYPGTPFFHHPDEFGLTILPERWDLWDRYSLKPVFEDSHYRQQDLVAACQKALEVKSTHESLSIMRHFVKDRMVELPNGWNALVAPGGLPAIEINIKPFEKLWEDLGVKYHKGLVGLFFTDDKVMVRMSPLSPPMQEALNTLGSMIVTTLGGFRLRQDDQLLITGTNRNHLNGFALCEVLLALSRDLAGPGM